MLDCWCETDRVLRRIGNGSSGRGGGKIQISYNGFQSVLKGNNNGRLKAPVGAVVDDVVSVAVVFADRLLH